jgi:lysophospholipase L1-like esterase
LYALLLVLCSLSVALAGAELFLRYQKKSIQHSDAMDPGLVVYDRYLGWKLAPRWQGGHRHQDFSVRYTTNAYGFRGDFDARGGGRVRYAVVGDSFTFGLGVNDADTFVSRLNAAAPDDELYLNFGVPGYSTDQEYILLRRRVFDFSPQAVVLVTYLGNDLFDNQLPFPLQADHAKPYFELSSGKLVLRNSPVPMATKPPQQAAIDLKRVVLGEVQEPRNPLLRRLENTELFQLVQRSFSLGSDRRDLFPVFEKRFAGALLLYDALLAEIRSLCRRHDAPLTLVLLAGRSFVERPGSNSAQFQDFFRQRITAAAGKHGIAVIDLAAYLKRYSRENKSSLFYPNEGHLTPEGNRVTAEFLARRIAEVR